MSKQRAGGLAPKVSAGTEGGPFWVAVLTVATSGMAAVNEFTSALQFEPFLVDLGFAAAALAFAAYFICVRAPPGSFKVKTTYVFAATILVLVFVISLVRPIQSAFRGPWAVCGTFASDCHQNSCLRLWDEKGRRSIEDCLSLDESGYLSSHSEGWWRYSPVKVSLVCGLKEGQPVLISHGMLGNHTCSGYQEMHYF